MTEASTTKSTGLKSRNILPFLLMIAGIVCIQLGTAGPLQDIAGILWPAAVLLFAAAAASAVRGYRAARQRG